MEGSALGPILYSWAPITCCAYYVQYDSSNFSRSQYLKNGDAQEKGV